MNKDGESRSKQEKGARYMVTFTKEELEEIKLAMAARGRATGSGTRNHEVCVEVVKKIADSERKADARVVHGSKA